MTLRTILCSLVLSLSMTICLGRGDVLCAQQEFSPFLAEVTGDQVNVRSGQSANFERLCQLNKGDEVVVVEKGFSWYKIQLPPTAKAFINKEYVQYLGQNAGGVIGDRVNIRAGAGIHFTVLGQLTNGEQIYIAEELDEWFRIEPVAQSYGWVADKFIAFKSNDVSEYQAKTYVKPSVAEDLVKPIDEPVEVKEEEEGKEVQPVDEGREYFTAVGYVEKYDRKNDDGIYYRIVERGRPICYVQGVNHILGRFSHQKVSVVGKVIKKLQSKYIYPTITVSSVRLML